MEQFGLSHHVDVSVFRTGGIAILRNKIIDQCGGPPQILYSFIRKCDMISRRRTLIGTLRFMPNIHSYSSTNGGFRYVIRIPLPETSFVQTWRLYNMMNANLYSDSNLVRIEPSLTRFESD